MLSGCWDKVEIDRRIFISTMAVDVGRDIGKEDKFKDIKSNEIFNEKEFNKLSITYGFPDISEVEPGKTATGKEKFITIDAFSMEDGMAKMVSRSSRTLHLGHIKLLILSDELLRHPDTVKEILDYIERKPCINRMMLVVVAKGRSEDYVKYQPVMEKNIESYITGIMENSGIKSNVIPIKFNELAILLYQNGNAIIPNISFDKAKNEIYLSGVALIKNYELQGNLDSEETSALEMLRGKIKGGKEVVFKDGHPIEFEIEGAERKISLVNDNYEKGLEFKVDIKLEGQLKQYYLEEDVFEENDLKEIQSNFNDVIEKKCEKVTRITQEKYSIDPIGFREYVEKFKPKLYEKIKDDWDEVYEKANIDINVETRIRRIGTTK
nr:Ger(x)C family spore germination protein [Clostridium aestuarii]